MKRQLRISFVLLVGLCAALGESYPCAAAPIYYLREIVSPEGKGIFPLGVNANNRATGSYYRSDSPSTGTYSVAFLYDGMNVIDLGFSGSSIGHSINDSQQIAGEWEGQAFIWSSGGVQLLGTLGGATSAAYDLNNSGQAVGYSENASGKVRPFVYAGGQMVELPLPAGFDTGIAFGINDQGQVVGSVLGANSTSRAVLWQNGQLTDLGDFGGTLAQANSINDVGDIVGSKRNSVVDPSTAFLLRNNQPQFFCD
jgi:probable HAF family extracellular repeat protein